MKRMLAGWFARRYFLSRKSHAVINVIAGVSVVSIAVPVAAMIILLSVFNGFAALVRSMNSHFDADLTLTAREGGTFVVTALDTAALRRVPGVASVSYLLEQSALVEYRNRQALASVRGVDDAYSAAVPVGECISAGEYRVRLGDLDQVVLGRGLAYELGVRSLGESNAVLYALRRTGFSSLLPIEGYTRRQADVSGIYAADAETDSRYLFTSLRLAQELFTAPGRVSMAVIRVAEEARVAEVKRRIAGLVGAEFELRTRDELNASFYTIMQYEKWGIFLMSFLVLVIASFSIVGAVVMLVLDKRPSFVTLYAMGADTRFIRRIFYWEGALVGGLGALSGVVLGVALCLLQQHFGLIEIPADSFLVKSYPVLLRGGDIVAVVAAFTLVIGTITAVTVRRAVRTTDVVAVRLDEGQ